MLPLFFWYNDADGIKVYGLAPKLKAGSQILISIFSKILAPQRTVLRQDQSLK